MGTPPPASVSLAKVKPTRALEGFPKISITAAGGTGVFGASNHHLGVGVYGKGERLTAYFDGDVEVTGDIRLINKADFAEDFEVAERVEPGTVMVLGDNGELH